VLVRAFAGDEARPLGPVLGECFDSSAVNRLFIKCAARRGHWEASPEPSFRAHKRRLV